MGFNVLVTEVGLPDACQIFNEQQKGIPAEALIGLSFEQWAQIAMVASEKSKIGKLAKANTEKLGRTLPLCKWEVWANCSWAWFGNLAKGRANPYGANPKELRKAAESFEQLSDAEVAKAMKSIDGLSVAQLNVIFHYFENPGDSRTIKRKVVSTAEERIAELDFSEAMVMLDRAGSNQFAFLLQEQMARTALSREEVVICIRGFHSEMGDELVKLLEKFTNILENEDWSKVLYWGSFTDDANTTKIRAIARLGWIRTAGQKDVCDFVVSSKPTGSLLSACFSRIQELGDPLAKETLIDLVKAVPSTTPLGRWALGQIAR